MIKNWFMIVIALISSLSIEYAYYNYQMKAPSGYQAGGTISGRIVTVPTNITKLSKGEYHAEKGLLRMWYEEKS